MQPGADRKERLARTERTVSSAMRESSSKCGSANRMALIARRPLGDVMRARKVTTWRTEIHEERDEQRRS
jgi:hypothetical protein